MPIKRSHKTAHVEQAEGRSDNRVRILAGRRQTDCLQEGEHDAFVGDNI